MNGPPRLFDRDLHRLRLDRASRSYADFLKARTADDAIGRLDSLGRAFPMALDLGARDGAFARALAEAPQAGVETLVEADLSPRMLDRSGLRVVADEERLPFAPASFDLVTALLALHWCNDLVGALIQIRRVLKPGGVFLGAVFGAGTLVELRQSLLQAEAEVAGGAGLRISPFADAYDGAGLMQRAGFADPVSEVERVTVRYAHPLKLMADLRAMGETNALVDRARRPLGRPVLARAFAIYQERYGLEDGRIPATFEIVSLTGRGPPPAPPAPERDLARRSR